MYRPLLLVMAMLQVLLYGSCFASFAWQDACRLGTCFGSVRAEIMCGALALDWRNGKQGAKTQTLQGAWLLVGEINSVVSCSVLWHH